MSELWFSVLGRLQARVGGREVALGPRKQQIVLAALLGNPNRYTSLDALIEAVWGHGPPRTARKNLHVYVCNLRSRLRHAGGRECIANRDHGYVISVASTELDSLAFEEMARAGAHLGDIAVQRQALDLWRGPAFEGFDTVPAIAAEAELLSRRYVTVFETWAEAALAESPATVVDEIDAVVFRDPFREGLRVIQMTALHQQGRHAQALAVFDDYRQALAREFGLPPGPAMMRLRDQVLLEQPDPTPPAVVPGRSPALPRLPGVVGRAGFVGRAAELTELTAALGEHGETLAVVTGPVGTGKTALALRCAHEVARLFPDGQYFVALRDPAGAPRPTRTALRDLLRDVGVAAGPQDPSTVWQSWIGRRRALIVLDDAPDEASVLGLMPLAGDSATLVTARRRLSGLAGAYRLDLGPLRADDGLNLLAQHIGADRVARNHHAAQEIVRAAGLLPLAIMLVGSKLAGLRHVPLHEYAGRLSGPARLDELSVGALALRTRLETVLRDLPDPARGDYARLGRLRSPTFTLAEAVVALGTDHETAARALEDFLEANLVAAPDVEVSAHEVVYEVPPLLFHHMGELATLSVHNGTRGQVHESVGRAVEQAVQALQQP